MMLVFLMLCLTFSELMVVSINLRTWNLPETYWSKIPVLEAVRSMEMLVSTNLILVAWFAWSRHQQEVASRWQRVAQTMLRLVVWAITMGISYVIYFVPFDAECLRPFPDQNGFDIVSFSAAPSTWQAIWLLVDWVMEKTALTRNT